MTQSIVERARTFKASLMRLFALGQDGSTPSFVRGDEVRVSPRFKSKGDRCCPPPSMSQLASNLPLSGDCDARTSERDTRPPGNGEGRMSH